MAKEGHYNSPRANEKLKIVNMGKICVIWDL